MFQCYYNETILMGKCRCTGAKVIVKDALFDNEADAERYCTYHSGMQRLPNGMFVENELKYESV